MPPFWFAVAAAAGVYAGVRLIAKGLQIQAEANRRDAHDTTTEAPGARRQPVDLGQLEWDQASGVYKPRTRH
ncbi:MAG: hypothetical protein NW216_12135 [Hyphomicrobium sp.]|nr:hypothetical protein [Hyphomicrobium sp.]